MPNESVIFWNLNSNQAQRVITNSVLKSTEVMTMGAAMTNSEPGETRTTTPWPQPGWHQCEERPKRFQRYFKNWRSVACGACVFQHWCVEIVLVCLRRWSSTNIGRLLEDWNERMDGRVNEPTNEQLIRDAEMTPPCLLSDFFFLIWQNYPADLKPQSWWEPCIRWPPPRTWPLVHIPFPSPASLRPLSGCEAPVSTGKTLCYMILNFRSPQHQRPCPPILPSSLLLALFPLLVPVFQPLQNILPLVIDFLPPALVHRVATALRQVPLLRLQVALQPLLTPACCHSHPQLSRSSPFSPQTLNTFPFSKPCYFLPSEKIKAIWLELPRLPAQHPKAENPRSILSSSSPVSGRLLSSSRLIPPSGLCRLLRKLSLCESPPLSPLLQAAPLLGLSWQHINIFISTLFENNFHPSTQRSPLLALALPLSFKAKFLKSTHHDCLHFHLAFAQHPVLYDVPLLYLWLLFRYVP